MSECTCHPGRGLYYGCHHLAQHLAPPEVTPKMVDSGLAVFHKTFLDRETMIKAVYRAMHEAKLNA